MIAFATRFLGNSMFKRIGLASTFGGIRGEEPSFRFARRSSSSSKCPSSQKDLTFKTRMALPADHDCILSFLCEFFFPCEPVYRYLGLAKEPVPKGLVKLLHNYVKQGMTIVAVDKNKRIVGAAVNMYSCPWDPEREAAYARHCETGAVQDYIEFFAHLSREPDLWNRFCVLKVFDCNSLAVDPEFQGSGVGRKLVQDSLYLAENCNYPLFRIDCTSRYTAKIAENLGYECVYSLPYSSYVKNCERVFQNVEKEHACARVYIQRLYCRKFEK